MVGAWEVFYIAPGSTGQKLTHPLNRVGQTAVSHMRADVSEEERVASIFMVVTLKVFPRFVWVSNLVFDRGGDGGNLD